MFNVLRISMTMFNLGDFVSIKKTDGTIIEASVFKTSSSHVYVQWLENGQLVGKKVYLEDIIQQKARQNSVCEFFMHNHSQILLGLFILSIFVIFLAGVFHNFNSSKRVRFLYF